MQLREVMTPYVECLSPADNLVHAAKRMRDLNVGSMPVCGENDRVAGIITDRDITVRATAACCDPGDTRVKDVMTPEITTCFEEDTIDKAVSLMEKKQIRRLAILNHAKRLVGIVSLGDLAVRSGDSELSGEALEQISEPAAAT